MLSTTLIQPIRTRLRPVKRFFVDQCTRGTHLLQCLKGKDIWFQPQVSRKKVRLGKDDGEWCFCPSSINAESVVYSFGVGKDISFDLALIERFGLHVHAFDPTPVSLDWIAKQNTPPEFHFHPFGIANYDGTAKFSLPVQHAISFTMLADLPGKRDATGEVCRLSTILERLGHERIHLLKLDVEGTEYDLIPEIVALSGRIDQLLIEFHHRLLVGEDKLERTRKAFASLFDAGFRLFYSSPRGLEYSFVRV